MEGNDGHGDGCLGLLGNLDPSIHELEGANIVTCKSSVQT